MKPKYLALAAVFLSVTVAHGQSVSKVTLTPSSVIGGANVAGTVFLDSKAPKTGVTVNLTSDTGAVNVLETVKIPAGTDHANFTAKTNPVAADTTAHVTAQFGTSTASTNLTVTAPVPTSLSLSPSSLSGGSKTYATLTISGKAPIGGITFKLSSDHSFVTVPPDVTIPAGAISGRIVVSSIPVATDNAATIIATNGSTSKGAQLTVLAPKVKSLSLSPYNVFAGQSANAVLTLTSPAPAGGLTFNSRVNSDFASVPPTFTVPAGRVTGYLPITTVDNGKTGTAVIIVNDIYLTDLSVYGNGLGKNSSWPKFRGGLTNTGLTARTGTTGSLAWSVPLGSINDSSPAIDAGGNVYLATHDKLLAYRPDGTLGWSSSLPGTSLSTPAIADDGTIYVGSGANLVAYYYYGNPKWSFKTGDWVKSSPTIATDGTIIFGSQDGNVYALDRKGNQKWVFKTGGAVLSSPAIDANGNIYVGSNDNNLYVLNKAGKKLWSFATGGIVQTTPALDAKGNVYFGSDDHKLYAVNAKGKQLWAFDVNSTFYGCSPAIAADGTIYIGAAFTPTFYALNPNGSIKWSLNAGETVSSPAIAGDGTIYVGSRDKNVYAINPNGTVKWKVLTGAEAQPSPAIGPDGTVYIPSLDNILYAIK